MFNLTTKFMTKILVLISSILLSANSLAANDPTKPLFSNTQTNTVKSKSRLILQSVIKRNNKLSVVINGKLLSEGDKISTYRVSHIKENQVSLISEDKQLLLSLFSTNKFSKVVKN